MTLPDPGPADSHRIENAGLVLCAPFLPALFDSLSLLKGQGFRSVAHAVRAVWLLEHLVSRPGGSLLLNKILCNVPIAPAPDKPLLPSAEEKAGGDEMLQAMIGHWPAIKPAGIEGLRHQFLSRAGTLHLDGRQVLTVEPLGLDVLLEQLPWGFSVVKLPWMPHPLRVEWL